MAHEVSAGPLPALGRSNARARAVPFLGSILLSATVTVWVLWFACRGPLTFDDAYMFHRYGTHVLSGLGVVWNEGGAPTYGLTSQLWLFLLLPLFMLPLSAASALQLASWLTGGLAVAVMGRTVARGRKARCFPLLRRPSALSGCRCCFIRPSRRSSRPAWTRCCRCCSTLRSCWSP